MSFSEAIKAGFSGYVDFQGRSSRSAYWWWTLFVVLVSIVLSVIGMAIFGPESGTLLANLWSLVVLLPGIAVAIRRLHDLDRSGWFLLLALIPLIGSLILLYWFCCKGTDGDNRFGPDPLG